MSPLPFNLFWAAAYPFAVLWAGLTRFRRSLRLSPKAIRTQAKTVVVGNLHSGGSGKTPIVAAIAEHYRNLGPAIVSRGYGGTLSRIGGWVDPGQAEGPLLYGDEPWMLSQRLMLPVFIGANRGQALLRVQEQTPGFFLLDDAFQNRSFRHDVDLVAIQADRPLSDAYCLPLGQLREPLSALGYATGVVLVEGVDRAAFDQWKAFIEKRFPSLPLFVTKAETKGLFGKKGAVEIKGAWGAVCAIARPQAFQNQIASLGRQDFFRAYPDHHVYRNSDVDALRVLSQVAGTQTWVTTEKDWHKLAPLVGDSDPQLVYLRIEYGFSDAFWYFLDTHLETA